MRLVICRVKLPKSFLAVNVSDSHATDTSSPGPVTESSED